MEVETTANGHLAPHSNRRLLARFPVDEDAWMLLVNHGSRVPCKVLDISQGGCRLSTRERFQAGIMVRVEVNFKVRGLAFRFSGVTQWTDSRNQVGIRFVDVIPRRREELIEALHEIELELAAVAAKKAAMAASSNQDVAPADRASVEAAGRGKEQKSEVGSRPAKGPARASFLGSIFARPFDPVRPASTPAPLPGSASPKATEPSSIDAETSEISRASIFGSDPEQWPYRSRPKQPNLAETKPPESAPQESKLPETKPLQAGPLGGTSAASPSAPPAPAGTLPKGRDRRAESRQGVDTTAVLYLVKIASRLTGRILDLSPSGCRIRTDERFPVGIYTRIETEFRLEGLPFRLGGVVQAIHDRHHIGIRFLDMSDRKREQVEQLIEEIKQMYGETYEEKRWTEKIDYNLPPD